MKRKLSVLLVEDNQSDADTIIHAFRNTDPKLTVTHLLNGEEALNHLNSSKKMPGIIVLDLQMPVMDGFVFLRIIRQNPIYRSIPVVVLTGHNDDFHKNGSFEHNIAGFMLKPVDYDGYRTLIGNIISYWSLSEIIDRT